MALRVGVFGRPRTKLVRVALTTPIVLEGFLVGGALLYVVVFFAAGLLRLFFSYPLEITEGATLREVRDLLHGEPLYVQPTLEHVPMIYGPVYYYAAAIVSLAVGPTFGALRAVSLVASTASVALIGLIVGRETRSRIAAVVAAGVFAASYPLADGTLDLARVDALMLALVLGAIVALRLPGRRASVMAGALLAVAVLTKQAALPVVGVVLLYLLLDDPRRLLPFGAALAATVAVPLAFLEIQSGRWAMLFLLQLPRQHAISELRVDQFWRLWVLPRFTLALPLGLLFLIVANRRSRLFYGLVSVGMLGTSWASDSNPGANLNVLLPAYAMLSILFGLGLAEALRQLSAQRTYLGFATSVGILQLVLMIYNPRLMVPYRSDTWADDRLASTLARLPGKVFAPDFDAYLPDDPGQPYAGSVAELLGGYGGVAIPEGGALLGAFRDRLAKREYDYVVLDPDSQWFFFKGPLRDADYADAGPLFPDGDEYWLWHTPVEPKAELFVPAERMKH